MKKQILYNFVMLLIILTTANSLFAGGGRRNGTGGASELLIPVGVRGISLGGSNVATSSGVEALFWNPAGLARTFYSVEASFSYMSYIADMGITYGAVSTNIEDLGIFTLGIKSIGVGDIPVTTVDNPDGTGQNFTPQLLTFGLSYSRKLSDRISVGLTGNMIYESMDKVNATGVAFNVGVMYQNLGGINGLDFGIAIKNLGPEMKFDGSGLYHEATAGGFKRPSQLYKIDAAPFELPSMLELGFGYRKYINQENSVLISTAFQNNNFSGDTYNLGAEYTFNDMISLRGGYSYVPEDQETIHIYGLTAGVGLHYQMKGADLRFDYGYRDVEYFEGNHIFSVSIGF